MVDAGVVEPEVAVEEFVPLLVLFLEALVVLVEFVEDLLFLDRSMPPSGVTVTLVVAVARTVSFSSAAFSSFASEEAASEDTTDSADLLSVEDAVLLAASSTTSAVSLATTVVVTQQAPCDTAVTLPSLSTVATFSSLDL